MAAKGRFLTAAADRVTEQEPAMPSAKGADTIAAKTATPPVLASPVVYENRSTKPDPAEQQFDIQTENPSMNTSIRMPLEAANPANAPTVIRAGLHLEGNIRTTDDILLEGSVRGEVSANSITIAAGAFLSGNVSATVIVVDGTVEGLVRCLKLQVNTTGAVSGEIHHSILVVEAGASIEGTVFRTEHLSDDSAPSTGFAQAFAPAQAAMAAFRPADAGQE